MKVLVLQGRDFHTYRLVQGFLSCGVEVFETSNELDNFSKFDIAFVDPSYPHPVDKINADRILFYDCEDDPKSFERGEAYEALKDSVEFYAKLVYIEDDRGDGIKNIAFPINYFTSLINIANSDLSHIPYTFNPLLIAAPTWLEVPPEQVKEDDKYSFSKEEDIYSFDIDKNREKHYRNTGMISYNQRIDWLLSMEQNDIPHTGGLVFKDYTHEYVGNIFGTGVSKWDHPRIGYMDNLLLLHTNKVCLCPGGHDRISWRTFDIMAMGSILFWTDVGDRKMLYMPEVYVKVKDGESLAEVISTNEDSFPLLLEESIKNKEIMKTLTPERILKDFLRQMV